MSKFHTRNNTHITEIKLKVKDIDKSIKFYTEILGFKILEDKENKAILTTDGDNPIIELISSEGLISKPKMRTGLYHIAILLSDRIQLGLFLKHLRNKEYPIIGGSNHGATEAIYLEDLDSNGIEIYADLPDTSWERKEDRIHRRTLPLDYERLIGDTEDLQWEGMPSDTIIGHIHLHVSNLEEAKIFYRDGIGLDIVSEMGNSAVFLSSANYHHHLAFNIWNGKGSEPLPENSVGMEYYTIGFPSEEILEERIRQLEDLDYNVFEENNNIFVKDPSNNLIKLKSF